MEKEKIELYLAQNAKYFESSLIPELRNELENTNDATFLKVESCELKNPDVLLIISILFGGFGIDRFIIGDIGLGLLKLFTCGGFGIMLIYDWFTIRRKTRLLNTAAISLIVNPK